MTLREFISILSDIEKQGGSHPILDGRLRLYLGDDKLEIEEIEPIRNMGCGCWIGANVNLKKEKS